MQTGLLFSTPEEFVLLGKQLLLSSSLAAHLTKSAREFVDANFSPEKERSGYLSLLKGVCPASAL
jgi:hypothetical protein